MMIHQLQATYVMEHDRILVRLNTLAGEELRLWLTRRMVRILFPYISQATTELVAEQTSETFHDGSGHIELAQFKKQESLQRSDFATPFNNTVMTLPIGDSPLLATTVHITPQEGAALRVGFEENIPGAAGKRGFEVTLGQDLLHGFLHLLESALQHAAWGIGPEQGEVRNDAVVADTFACAKPPRFLN